MVGSRSDGSPSAAEAGQTLLADNFRVRGGCGDANEPLPVGKKNDLVVLGFGAQLFELLAARILLTKRFHGDDAGRQILRDQHGEGLRPHFLPIVEARENGVLVVKLFVEHVPHRRIESEFLGVWFRPFQLQLDCCSHSLESDRAGSLLRALGGPCVTNGGAIRAEFEISSDMLHGALFRLNFRAAVGDPISSAGRNFILFLAHFLAAGKDAEFSLVWNEERSSRGICSGSAMEGSASGWSSSEDINRDGGEEDCE